MAAIPRTQIRQKPPEIRGFYRVENSVIGRMSRERARNSCFWRGPVMSDTGWTWPKLIESLIMGNSPGACEMEKPFRSLKGTVDLMAMARTLSPEEFRSYLQRARSYRSTLQTLKRPKSNPQEKSQCG